MARPGVRRSVGGESSASTAATRAQLVAAAIEALKEVGYGGASAREIARRAGCNQGLVFYHFGSVANLLLAALDEVSRQRLERYRSMTENAGGLVPLTDAARAIFEEDLDAGHMTVLAEMIAGAVSTPGLGDEVAARLVPWREFAARAIGDGIRGTPLEPLVPALEAAHAVVALYLGLEMLAHLDGDRAPALALFERLRQAVSLFVAFGGGDGEVTR